MKKYSNSFNLKIVAIIFMCIDHIQSYLGPFLGWPSWVSFLGRFVAPLFVFFLVEGFFYTHNRRRYFNRLFLGGIGMYAINLAHNLITKDDFSHPVTGEFDPFSLIQGQNILMTLALLLLFIWGIDTLRSKKLKGHQLLLLSIGLLALIPFILVSEGGVYELPVVLMFYFFRGNFKKIALGVTAFCALLLAHALFNYWTIPEMGSLYQVLSFSNEFMMISVLPFIYFYNGKRGGNGARWQKELFYYFYPLHLILIYFLQDLFLQIH